MTKFEAETFPSLLRQVVAARGDHPALIAPGLSWTYADLERETSRMARAMLASGVGKGTRVGVLAPPGQLWLTVFYASLRVGALVTCVSTIATPAELGQIIRRGDIQFLVAQRSYLRHDYAEKLESAVGLGLDDEPGHLRLAAAPFLRAVWLDDWVDVTWAKSVEDLLARADGPRGVSEDLLAQIESEVTPSDEALMVFTSGSTAMPKAVVHYQQSVAEKPALQLQYRRYAIETDDRLISVMPNFWMGGIIASLATLSAGATLVYPRSVDAVDVVDMLLASDATRFLGAIPGDMRIVDELARRGESDRAGRIPGLVAHVPGPGAPGLARFSNTIGFEAMGMSEAFGFHTSEPKEADLLSTHPGSVGRAVPGFERRVVDPVTGADVEPGTEGELWLRGGSLMSRYYKVDGSDTFTREGFFRTADRVVIEPDGYTYFFGRLSDVIKSKGANVSSAEVELALRSVPGVELAFVAGLPDPVIGQVVAAAVVLSADADLSESAIQEALREKLSGFKVPRHIVAVRQEEVPRTAGGKPKVSELADFISKRVAAGVR